MSVINRVHWIDADKLIAFILSAQVPLLTQASISSLTPSRTLRQVALLTDLAMSWTSFIRALVSWVWCLLVYVHKTEIYS
jgi:hypothetical protein